MNEMIKQGEAGVLPMGNELTKALVDKTIENGTAIMENTKMVGEIGELIRKLPDPWDGFRELGERLGNLSGLTDTVKKETNSLKETVQKLVARETLPPSVIETLREDLKRHAQLFEKPLEKSIRHTHLLGRPFLTLGGMFLLVLATVFFWNRTWERAERSEEGDLKWRFMKLDTDRVVRHVFARAEYEYKTDPGQFKKDVEGEEDLRKDLFANWAQNDTAMQQIYDFKTRGRK